MIKLYFLIRYSTRSNRPNDAGIPREHKDEIIRSHLVSHLMFEKQFCEDWRDTLIRWYYYISRNRQNRTYESRAKRFNKQRKKINDLIDKALEKKYLLISRTASLHPTSSEVYLTTNWRGRDFLKPHYFIEAWAREFSYLASIFTSFIFGVGGTLLIIFWKKIIDYFIN